MSDTIQMRVCFIHEERHKYGPISEDCDMADALVIRADQPVYRIDEDHPDMTDRAKAWFEVAKVKGVLRRIGEDT